LAGIVRSANSLAPGAGSERICETMAEFLKAFDDSA
jgi:hypothetical protein